MSGQYPTNVELHRWAEAQPWGHKVPARGKLNWLLIRAWDKAHPDRPYVKSQAYHGTQGGYNNHQCRCQPCTDAVAGYRRDAYHADKFGADS